MPVAGVQERLGQHAPQPVHLAGFEAEPVERVVVVGVDDLDDPQHRGERRHHDQRAGPARRVERRFGARRRVAALGRHPGQAEPRAHPSRVKGPSVVRVHGDRCAARWRRREGVLDAGSVWSRSGGVGGADPQRVAAGLGRRPHERPLPPGVDRRDGGQAGRQPRPVVDLDPHRGHADVLVPGDAGDRDRPPGRDAGARTRVSMRDSSFTSGCTAPETQPPCTQ